jgi:hypothetical protein
MTSVVADKTKKKRAPRQVNTIQEKELNSLLEKIPQMGELNWNYLLGYDGLTLIREEDRRKREGWWEDENDDIIEQFNDIRSLLLTRGDVKKLRKGKIKTLKVIGPIGNYRKVVTLTKDDPRLEIYQYERGYKMDDKTFGRKMDNDEPARSSYWSLQSYDENASYDTVVDRGEKMGIIGAEDTFSVKATGSFLERLTELVAPMYAKVYGPNKFKFKF